MTVDIQSLKQTVGYAEEAFVVDAQSFLHALMEDKGVSRAQLAAAMGVSRARVSQIFSADCTNFTVRLLARACFALGERAEITCAHNQRKQNPLKERHITLRQQTWASSWEAGALDPQNDNNAIEIGAQGAVEFSKTDAGLVKHLLSSLGKVPREKVAA